jgi:CRP-like cAMP-binding protein
MKQETKNIHNTYLFSCLSAQEVEKLFEDTPIVVFNKNETIYKQESYASHAYYLLDGFAKIYIEHKNQIQTVNIIKPLWFIGLFSNFAYEKHAFSAKAISDIKVVLIPKEKLENSIKTNPEFAVRYIKSVSLLGTDISFFGVVK